MRSALLLILGLVVGAFGAVKVNNALQLRDAYPDGVMHVMSHHLGVLSGNLHHGKCPAKASSLHLQRLDAMQVDIVPAFGNDIGAKPDFRKHVHKLKQAIEGAIADAPADCQTLKKAVSNIGGACKSCHQIYR